MNLRHQIECQCLFIQMKSHFELAQGQDYYYISFQIFLSKYKFSLSQFDKLYYHINSFLEYLKIEIYQKLQKKYKFSINNLKFEMII